MGTFLSNLSQITHTKRLSRVLNVPADIVKTGLTSLQASTWYYVYLYENAQAEAAVEVSDIAPSATYKGMARNMIGDNSRRYLGVVLTDAAGSIRPFKSE